MSIVIVTWRMLQVQQRCGCRLPNSGDRLGCCTAALGSYSAARSRIGISRCVRLNGPGWGWGPATGASSLQPQSIMHKLQLSKYTPQAPLAMSNDLLCVWYRTVVRRSLEAILIFVFIQRRTARSVVGGRCYSMLEVVGTRLRAPHATATGTTPSSHALSVCATCDHACSDIPCVDVWKLEP